MLRPTRRPRASFGSRGIALTLGTVLLAGAFATGTAQALPAPDNPSAAPAAASDRVTSGNLSWGVRTSIRNYLENFGHTNGSVEARPPATYAPGDEAAVFPVTSGTVDAVAGTADIEFGGAFNMKGFGEAWFHFDQVRLVIENQTATVRVNMRETYQNKTAQPGFAIARFPLAQPPKPDANGVLELRALPGKFTTEAVANLPVFGAESPYAAPNDFVDPLSVRVQVGEPATNPSTPPTPDPSTPPTTPSTPPTTPETGPYGASQGKALAGSAARITVTPGYALNANGDTPITVQGTGFDPGTAAPGEGTGGIYVGFGQLATPTDTESWRRSKGGVSGVGRDFNYGAPRFVAAHNTANGAVADAVMDAQGNWTFSTVLPGKTLASFFDPNATMDCVEAQCGVLSFGAHGVINAANEAYTPLYFQGQDETGWPERGTVVVPPITTPSTPPTTPSPQPSTPAVPDLVTPPVGKAAPYGTSTGTNPTGASLTVSPAWSLGDKQQQVTLTGKGYDTSKDFGGAYVLFGWIDPAKGTQWGPAGGGRTGFEYVYHQEEEFQGLVLYPGNTNAGSTDSARQGRMDAAGNWSGTFTIPASQFTAFGKTIDCYRVQCGVITIGAHGVRNAGVEVFTPVYFTGEADNAVVAGARPDTVSGQGQAIDGQGLAGTGFDQNQRPLWLLSALILSGALFSIVLARRFRRTTPETATSHN